MLWPYLREHRVRYAVVSPVGTQVAQYNHLLFSVCQSFVLIRGFGDHYGVLRLRNPDEAIDSRACQRLEPWSTLPRPVPEA